MYIVAWISLIGRNSVSTHESSARLLWSCPWEEWCAVLDIGITGVTHDRWAHKSWSEIEPLSVVFCEYYIICIHRYVSVRKTSYRPALLSLLDMPTNEIRKQDTDISGQWPQNLTLRANTTTGGDDFGMSNASFDGELSIHPSNYRHHNVFDYATGSHDPIGPYTSSGTMYYLSKSNLQSAGKVSFQVQNGTERVSIQIWNKTEIVAWVCKTVTLILVSILMANERLWLVYQIFILTIYIYSISVSPRYMLTQIFQESTNNCTT